MKNFYSLFAIAAFALNVNAQTTETFTYTIPTQENGTDALPGSVDNTTATVSYSWDQGENASNFPKYYNSGTAFRLYAKNEMTVSLAKANNQLSNYITKVEFIGATGGAYHDGNFTTNKTTVPVDLSKIGTANYETTVFTEADEITTVTAVFGPAATSGNTRITGIKVTYVYKLDPSMAVIDFGASKSKLVANTVVANDITFAAKADITVSNMNGQVVKTANVTEGGKLNVANLTPGMYIVTGVVNGKAVSQKIIKK